MKTFPILLSHHDRKTAKIFNIPESVPWSLVEPHARQALRNHEQTLERLAERGGLSPSELVAVLEDCRWRAMSMLEAGHRLKFFLAPVAAPNAKKEPNDG